jgi:hypothetical protein
MIYTNVPIAPENPNLLEGPEVGSLVICRNRYGPTRIARVIERSYVWAPDQIYGDGHGLRVRGYRHYNWSVIEDQPGKRVVVNDTDLTPLRVGDIVLGEVRAVDHFNAGHRPADCDERCAP